MSSTRDKILDHALARFNEAGVEAVGIRDIARELELSPGNVSYHFKKKDDLVAALASQLGETNTEIFQRHAEPQTLGELLEMYAELFENQHRFVFLPLSMVHLFERNPRLSEDYRSIDHERRRVIFAQLDVLRRVGELREGTTDEELRTIVAHISLSARFWVSEARVSFRGASPDAAIAHYLRLLASVLAAHASPEARARLGSYLSAPLLTLS